MFASFLHASGRCLRRRYKSSDYKIGLRRSKNRASLGDSPSRAELFHSYRAFVCYVEHRVDPTDSETKGDRGSQLDDLDVAELLS